MLRFLKRHRETLLVTLLGLLIFGGLNWMMVGVNPGRYTNAHLGPWSAFSNMYVSGLDVYTYSIVSMWQPRYELYRHPLLAVAIWPMSELNHWLKDLLGINCAIYIVGVVWTIISTLAWLLFYKITRKVVGLPWFSSLLYAFLLFSFSHVMLVTFVPDHMILSLCILMFSVYLISMARGHMPLWKTLLLYFIGTGITTTNCIKIWMMDMCGKYSARLSLRKNMVCLFKRSMFFFIPTTLLVGCFVWQQYTTQEEYKQGQTRMRSIKMRTDSVFAKQQKEKIQKAAEKAKRGEGVKDRQIAASELFKCTDTTVDRWPLLYENIFGEGILLHDTHVLEDANGLKHTRPIFVKYTHWWYYAINGIIILLCVWGLWVGRQKRITWLVVPMFIFDMFLHAGLRFAGSDVYIMTAHWAFILPIGIALLEKSIQYIKPCAWALRGVVLLIAMFMWIHNLTLTVEHMALF